MIRRYPLMAVLGLLLGLGLYVRADDDQAGPGHYGTLTLKKAREQVKDLKKDPSNAKAILAISQKIHDVNVLDVPPSENDAAPAYKRPQGSLQLNSVYVVDPSR